MRLVQFSSVLVGMLAPLLAAAQMSTGAGTGMVVDAGTTLRVNTATTWQIPTGAMVINNGDIVLGPNAELLESPGAAITGTGTERIQLDLAAPASGVDAGGLGGILTTNTAPGTTTFIRGHLPYTDYSGHTSIARWIHLLPALNSGLNATFSMRYDLNELNAVPELAQIMHIRAQDDIWWLLPTSVNTVDRTVTTSGLDSLGLFTTFDQDLPNAIGNAPDPLAFVLGTDPDGSPWLFVPMGQQVTLLEVIDPAGRMISSHADSMGAGWHRVNLTRSARGMYLLRVNGATSFPLACP